MRVLPLWIQAKKEKATPEPMVDQRTTETICGKITVTRAFTWETQVFLL